MCYIQYATQTEVNFNFPLAICVPLQADLVLYFNYAGLFNNTVNSSVIDSEQNSTICTGMVFNHDLRYVHAQFPLATVHIQL